jgi:cystathionine beta-lyase/cystathionine gamma-synthase
MRGADWCKQHGMQGHLVRFSTGLEAVADLQADLEQALVAVFRRR